VGERFEKVAVYLEQNIQDRDLEVKLEAVGSFVGLKTLKIVAPDGLRHPLISDVVWC